MSMWLPLMSTGFVDVGNGRICACVTGAPPCLGCQYEAEVEARRKAEQARVRLAEKKLGTTSARKTGDDHG